MNEGNSLVIGSINGHVVGRVLKEAVRRATVIIRAERAVFDTKPKQDYEGGMDDILTSADMKAQEVYLRTLEECFPYCGVIGEESALRIPPKGTCEAYFTVDPLDGTKAYVRRQSHGVATMVALVYRGEVVSAYIGDINANEVYGYRPDSESVYRITDLDTFEELKREEPINIVHEYALLRAPIEAYSPLTRETVARCFASHESMGSSIGTWAARLWKKEVGALFLPRGWETPWDSTPVFGISRKLGFVFMRPKGTIWEEYEPLISSEPYQRPYDTLIIHKTDIPVLSHLMRQKVAA